ncbi:MAG: undecaprenyldiphospho-muramoylpentapeptide beta-N-acetylglucosaminyltransferase [Candidatus Pacebacteria bacterium]|nr:undecaprenyldiphospho-muramoylpentapeptide beta-N-acetylglucosaminyltransferase [Candidatus Paceibacterota bacterium]
MKKKCFNCSKIIFTGGGTGGHVIPNIPLIKKFKEMNWEVFYIGSKNSFEEKIAFSLGIIFFSIRTGKLRRYFSLKNVTDFFLVIKGIFQALIIMRKINPSVIFSKGGFVSVPVVIAAWLLRIPIIAHESDVTLGLSSRITLFLSDKFCCGFPVTKDIYYRKNIIFTGTPIRQEIKKADKVLGLKIIKDTPEKKPFLFIIGGSTGAEKINTFVRKNLFKILEKYQIIHICGKGNEDRSLLDIHGYNQFSYIDENFFNILAIADIVVSRGGATSLYELGVLNKPTLVIPLSVIASRGDQIDNAKYFKQLGLAEILYEEDLNIDNFLSNLEKMHYKKYEIKEEENIFKHTDSINDIVKTILDVCNNKKTARKN